MQESEPRNLQILMIGEIGQNLTELKMQIWVGNQKQIGGAIQTSCLEPVGAEKRIVAEEGLEPTLSLRKTDFESVASAISPLGQSQNHFQRWEMLASSHYRLPSRQTRGASIRNAFWEMPPMPHQCSPMPPINVQTSITDEDSFETRRASQRNRDELPVIKNSSR